MCGVGCWWAGSSEGGVVLPGWAGTLAEMLEIVVRGGAGESEDEHLVLKGRGLVRAGGGQEGRGDGLQERGGIL